MEELPLFIYHPDPLATECIEPSDLTCRICGQARGYIYTGHLYSGDGNGLDNEICPWCIADGSAHERLNAEIIPRESVGEGGREPWEPVPDSIADEVSYRTPGFFGWESEKWFTHCGDAAVFLGIVGYEELKGYGDEAVLAIAEYKPVDEEAEGVDVTELDRESSPVGYLFRCRHCGKFGGYYDYD